MNETEVIRAEMEAVKLICLALLNNMPEREKLQAMRDMHAVVSLYDDALLFHSMTDAQRAHMREVVQRFVNLPPAT